MKVDASCHTMTCPAEGHRDKINLLLIQGWVIQGSEIKSPAICLFHPWSQLADFTIISSVSCLN